MTPRPALINDNVFAELWSKFIMKTDLKKDRDYITQNTPYLEYSDTEVKMLHTGQSLLVSEPRIHFAVPLQVTYYPEYLERREKVGYELPKSRTLSEMDETLKRLRQAGKALGS